MAVDNQLNGSALPPPPFMRIFCGCHPVIASSAGANFLPSAAVCGRLNVPANRQQMNIFVEADTRFGARKNIMKT